jgi:serine/threonine protein kinase
LTLHGDLRQSETGYSDLHQSESGRNRTSHSHCSGTSEAVASVCVFPRDPYPGNRNQLHLFSVDGKSKYVNTATEAAIARLVDLFQQCSNRNFIQRNFEIPSLFASLGSIYNGYCYQWHKHICTHIVRFIIYLHNKLWSQRDRKKNNQNVSREFSKSVGHCSNCNKR